MKNTIYTILLLIMSLLNVKAQDTIRINFKLPKIVFVKSNNTDTNLNAVRDSTLQTNQHQTRDFQATYVYPLGTNGIYAYKFANRLSLNILVGLNGGLDGVELGGIGNINNGNVRGCQFSGVFNINRYSVEGAQFASTFNVNGKDFKGGQFAGVFNINNGNIEGVQFAGTFNANNGFTKGAQGSGIFNLNNGCGKGFQGAGIFNANYGNYEGFQVASIFNANISLSKLPKTNLVQISSIYNLNTSQFKGLQLSAILNTAVDSMEGVQIGLINTAGYIKGVQIGLINIAAKSSKVVPIGLFNFVPNGLHEIEIAAGDLIYSNINLKLGVKQLYVIYKAGVTYNQSIVYSYGLGIGSSIKFSEKSFLSFELSSSYLTDLDFRSYDQLSKLDINFKYKILKHFAVFLGPSLNNYFSYSRNGENEPVVKPRYSLYSENFNNFQTFNWIGANLGISINF